MNYSIFIRSIKYIFLSIALVILLLVIMNNNSYSIKEMSTDEAFEESEFQSVNQVLLKPTFMGIDKKKQPFIVTASKATRYKSSPDIFNLEEPVGEIISGKEKYFISGKVGVFDKRIQQLKVEGNVEFNDGDSLVFNTSEVYFDFKKELLFGKKKVEGKKKNSLIISEGLKIFNRENKIIFTGKTKLTLKND
ncbi:MAG: LPS export ABC transporter periplasmic protein LptC [Pseudomonadota bacterium]|nr:LPS export ABC transporter periplasmic protein LptC [Pseudomonadota bacterium]